MTVTKHPRPTWSSLQGWMLGQLVVSFVVVGVAVLLLAIRLGMLAVLPGAMLGVLLTWNISSGLHLLELEMARLASSQALEPPRARRHWPLTPLFARVNTLVATVGRQVVDPQADSFRDQMAAQVSKTAAQEERNRLARDLHDSIKQQIFSIMMSAAAARVRWERDRAGAKQAVDEIERLAREAQVEMQALLQELRPVALENVGLSESLRMQCEALGYRTGAEVVAELTDLPTEEQLPPGAHELLFRIVQEGFSNIARHARAQHVWLSLYQQEEALLMEIGDDGQGFLTKEETPSSDWPPETHPGAAPPGRSDNVAQEPRLLSGPGGSGGSGMPGFGGMGLTNIRVRVRALGGRVSIWSQPEMGTTLHLYLPLVRESAEERAPDEQVQQARAAAQRWLRLSRGALELAAALALLLLPAVAETYALGMALLLAFWSWLWSQRYRAQVMLSVGRRSLEHQELQAEEAGLLTLAALLASIWLLGQIFSYQLNLWLFLTTAALGALAVLILTVRMVYLFNRLSRRLSAFRRGQERLASLRRLLVDGLAWAALASLMALVLRSYILAHTWAQEPWTLGTGLVLLLAWLLALVGRAWRIGSWWRQDQRKAVV